MKFKDRPSLAARSDIRRATSISLIAGGTPRHACPQFAGDFIEQFVDRLHADHFQHAGYNRPGCEE